MPENGGGGCCVGQGSVTGDVGSQGVGSVVFAFVAPLLVWRFGGGDEGRRDDAALEA